MPSRSTKHQAPRTPGKKALNTSKYQQRAAQRKPQSAGQRLCLIGLKLQQGNQGPSAIKGFVRRQAPPFAGRVSSPPDNSARCGGISAVGRDLEGRNSDRTVHLVVRGRGISVAWPKALPFFTIQIHHGSHRHASRFRSFAAIRNPRRWHHHGFQQPARRFQSSSPRRSPIPPRPQTTGKLAQLTARQASLLSTSMQAVLCL